MKSKILNIILHIILGFLLCLIGVNINKTINIGNNFNFYTSILNIIIVVAGGINISKYINKKTIHSKKESSLSTLPLIIGLLIAGLLLRVVHFI